MGCISAVTQILSYWIDNPKPYFTGYFVLHIYILLLFPICYIAYGSFFYAIIIFIGVVILIDLPRLLATLVRKISAKEKSFFKHWVEAHKNDKGKDAYQRIGERFGSNVNRFLALFIITVALAHASGSYVARKKTVFTVTDDMVLIRKYNDTFIFKEFDNKTNTLKNKIKVLDTAHVANLILEKKTIKKITNQVAHNISLQETEQTPRSH